ncbi:MAG: binding-protein-dependent transport system inner rane component [Anaerocolumna sp.]|jgi:multiple sugar transport system permease protein|nr:binding-protein-dependent transport system inner rane component [Anaerocolumna sp.]
MIKNAAVTDGIIKIRAINQKKDQGISFFSSVKKFLMTLLRIAILIGVGYVILSPIIGMVVNSISSDRDAYNPMVFVLPQFPTLERYKLVFESLDYVPTMARDLIYTLSLMLLQIVICSMVGYGFARFDFPLKKLLFGCVVVMIVIPAHTIMLPLYITFRQFDPLGIFTAITGAPINLMGTPVPMYIMTALGCGLRSGLYIYIFNQFFRGLPKEIEEAAFVDGAGVWYTYFKIMLVNATPAVITVAVFSMVWQFNDTFFAKLFLISEDVVISKKISILQATIANDYKILDTAIQELYLNAGIILVILPIVIIYLLLQRYFIEGVERSGIVG